MDGKHSQLKFSAPCTSSFATLSTHQVRSQRIGTFKDDIVDHMMLL
jgi:hypothetical protein